MKQISSLSQPRSFTTYYRSKTALSLLAIVLFLSCLLLGGVSGQASAADNSNNQLQNFNLSQWDSDGPGANWGSWGHDIFNSRFQPFSGPLNRRTVGNLQLKWAFAFPGTASASSQPVIVDNTLYVGSWNGHFYALDARTGQQKWDYDTATFTGALPAGTNAVRDGPALGGGRVYFGDILGNIYALNAFTGQQIWAKKDNSHPLSRITAAPVFYQGRLYVGISSLESSYALDPTFPCCTFRGSLVALDAASGNELWRYYTISQTPVQTGVNALGTPTYGPSGAAVWGSPTIDPFDGLIILGSGNNYTAPATDHSDSLIALDLATGQERWHNQLTPNDTWNLSCNPEVIGLPPSSGPNCPAPQGLDYDVSSSPNLFVALNPHTHQPRLLVGAGQKSGIYHALDARTGQIVWQTQLSIGTPGGQAGILWGTSWDGERLYVATGQAKPGSLSALDPATGTVLWNTKNPADGCTTGGAAGSPYCKLAFGGDPSSISGVTFQGSYDGKFRAFDSRTGAIIWQYDTRQSFTGVNGVAGIGGAINSVGASIANNGMVYVPSGYQPAPNPTAAGMDGNVLLAFSLR